MRRVLCAVALVAAAPATAQPPEGYKLVIVTGPGGGGVAVVDYPSRARCQVAAQIVEAEWLRRFEEAKERAANTPNTIVTGPAFTAAAFCIPS